MDTPNMPIMNVYDPELQQYVGFTAIRGEKGDPGKNGFGNGNILHNPYFVGGGTDGKFPINQMGQTSWNTAGYTFDRWLIDGGSAELLPTGMVLHTENGPVGFSQRLEYIDESLTYTATILADGVLYSATGQFPAKGGADATWANSHGDITITAANPAEGFPEIKFGFPQRGTTTNCHSAKLEIGTEQTHAKQVGGVWQENDTPDYGIELLKCLRYLYNPFFIPGGEQNYLFTGFSTNQNHVCGAHSFPVPMRTMPVLVISEISNILILGNNYRRSATGIVLYGVTISGASLIVLGNNDYSAYGNYICYETPQQKSGLAFNAAL